jgi:hypothetical protein
MILPTRKEHGVRGLGLIGGAVLILAMIVSAASAGDRARRPGERAASLAELVGVDFFHDCSFTHKKPDDPIVFPGEPGASHLHTFVGNRTTDAFSTYASLRSSTTTCSRTADRSAYWTPALYKGSKLILPTAATLYYRRFTLDLVRPFPDNLRMIAGSAAATNVQGTRVTFWSCGVRSHVQRSTRILTCPRGEFLHLAVFFPQCWDGRHLDSENHKSHMAYMRKGRCPSSHPIAVPTLEELYSYPIRGGDGISLSSGGLYSGHADFINAWKPEALRKLVDGCLNQLIHTLCRPPG